MLFSPDDDYADTYNATYAVINNGKFCEIWRSDINFHICLIQHMYVVKV